MRFYTADPPTLWQQARQGYDYRSLLWTLCSRDLRVHYRQTLLGVVWILLRPLILTFAFLIVFRGVGANPVETGQAYLPVALIGLVVWQYFAGATATAANAITNNEHIVTKVFFPRFILALVAPLTGLIELAIAAVPILILIVASGYEVSIRVLFLPCVTVWLWLITVSLTLWLSAANAIYRDIRHVVPFALQLGLIVSPVVYQSHMAISTKFRTVYDANPIAAVLGWFRWCLLCTTAPSVESTLASLILTAMMTVGGVLFFRRVDRVLVDRL